MAIPITKLRRVWSRCIFIRPLRYLDIETAPMGPVWNNYIMIPITKIIH